MSEDTKCYAVEVKAIVDWRYTYKVWANSEADAKSAALLVHTEGSGDHMDSHVEGEVVSVESIQEHH